MSPKILLRKVMKANALVEALVCWTVVFAGAGVLIFHVAGAVKAAPLSAGDVRHVLYSIALLLALITLSGAHLYKSSSTHMKAYEDVLRLLPFPVLLTDSEAVLRYANQPARELLCLEDDCEFGQFNVRHLIGENGSVCEKKWPHKGKNWLINGTCLTHAGKDLGYIIIMSQEKPGGETAERKRIFNDAVKLIGSLASITEFTSSCAGRVMSLADLLHGIATDAACVAVEDIEEIIHYIDFDMKKQLESNKAEIDVIIKTLSKLAPKEM